MVQFIFRNKYIFKLLVILALFYKNIFFYNSLCCNCCKENILDVKKNSKEIKTKKGKPKVEEIKTKKGKTKGKEIKTEIKKPKVEKIKIKKGKPKVKKEELEEVDVYIVDTVTSKKCLYTFPINIKGSDLKKEVAKKFNKKIIKIIFLSKPCEDNSIYTFEQGDTIYVYTENEKK